MCDMFYCLCSQVKRVADKQVLSDELRWAKFSGIAWTHDNKGFFYQVINYDDNKGFNLLHTF